MGSIDVPDPPCGTDPCREKLAVAAEGRELIGMAKGVIMVRSTCGPDAAFEILRRASMRENVKVRDIAVRLIDTATAAGDRAEAHLTR
jgi:AmiR/NasT family two-component response regulator